MQTLAEFAVRYQLPSPQHLAPSGHCLSLNFVPEGYFGHFYIRLGQSSQIVSLAMAASMPSSG
jgi:hypothetical protein